MPCNCRSGFLAVGQAENGRNGGCAGPPRPDGPNVILPESRPFSGRRPPPLPRIRIARTNLKHRNGTMHPERHNAPGTGAEPISSACPAARMFSDPIGGNRSRRASRWRRPRTSLRTEKGAGISGNVIKNGPAAVPYSMTTTDRKAKRAKSRRIRGKIAIRTCFCPVPIVAQRPGRRFCVMIPGTAQAGPPKPRRAHVLSRVLRHDGSGRPAVPVLRLYPGGMIGLLFTGVAGGGRARTLRVWED